MRRVAIAALVVITACAGVLGLTRSGPQPFPHRKHVLAGVSCTSCHGDMTQGGSAALHVPDDDTCTTCHARPHDPAPCLGCHASEGALAELADAREHLVFDHGTHAAPTKNNCMRCHVGVAEGDDRLRPPMATCFKCHSHDAASDARNCNACHKQLDDTSLVPQTHLAHDGDWLREHGVRAASSAEVCASCHKESFCADCHGKTVAALPASQSFSDPFGSGLHRAGFEARHALEARAQPGACTTCHQPASCAGCHRDKGVAGDGRRSPHPAGWVGITASENEHGREARRDPTACAGCHDGAGQQLCVGCHKVGAVGGNPHPAGWSSKLPASAMPCRLCHPIGSRP